MLNLQRWLTKEGSDGKKVYRLRPLWSALGPEEAFGPGNEYYVKCGVRFNDRIPLCSTGVARLRRGGGGA